jgi:hypothetical protein
MFRQALFAITMASLVACTGLPRTVYQPVTFGDSGEAGGEDFPNWPEHPLEAWELMTHGRFEVLSETGAGSGTTGAAKIEVRFLDAQKEFAFKAKEVPSRLDGINNSPRKELATWEIQKLFLDPAQYNVPTHTVRCVALEEHRKFHPHAKPTIPGTDCVLFVLAVWLENVTLPRVLYDDQRFLTEPQYAYHLANFNILSYLINLRDNRTGNVLVSSDDANRRVFAIDCGVAYGTAWFNWFYPPTFAWRQIRVAALPKQSIDRLRALGRDDLDALAVIVQLEPDGDGILRQAEPGLPFDAEQGARRLGTTVQFGLTEEEIDDLWERIEELVERVDAGEIPVF